MNVLGGPLLTCSDRPLTGFFRDGCCNTEFDFPGLQPGERWCLCAARWLESYKAGKAPRVLLNSTNQAALEIVPLEALKQYAADLH